MTRKPIGRNARRAFAILLLSGAAPLTAQTPASPPPDPDVPTPTETAPADPNAPPPAEAPATARQGTRSYAPADFARFSPCSALDMLNNVPGFSIDAGDTTRRGLGEATSNVLINGERFTGRSTDIFTELRRISAANVTRIDIADGSTFNISGLSGQVANIVTRARGIAGNFAYRPQIRARRTPARLLNGEIAINGPLGRGKEF
jgi:hypothetical protein